MLRTWISSLLLLPLALSAQEVIFLRNPSFEDRPGHSRPPWDWFDCGMAGETPPDVHPSGYFGVLSPPYQGRSYVGMVVRENGTWEALGQRLETPMIPGVCYRFWIYAARSDQYISMRLNDMEPVNYNGMARLRVWGGHGHCQRDELLWESSPVQTTDWDRLDMVLQPSGAYTHLVLEAFFRDPDEPPYIGNLLLDFASPLIPVDCDWPAAWSIPMDTLRAPRLGGLDELREYIMDQAQQVRLSSDSEGWERQVFQDEQGQVQQFNPHFWLIGQAVGQFPHQRLEVWLPGKMSGAGRQGADYALWRPYDFVMASLWRELEYALTAASLSPQQYRIRVAKRWGNQKAWLLPKKKLPYNLRLIQK